MSASVGQVATLDVGASTFRSLDDLLEAIGEHCPQPVGALQIAALLESAGVSDAIASQYYGSKDVFDLAQTLHEELAFLQGFTTGPKRDLPANTWRESVDYVARGPLGLLPMVLLTLMIMAYQHFGQWQRGQMLVLGISMLASLLVTSGFVQGASRKGASYLSQGYVRAATRIVSLVIASSVVVVLLIALVGTVSLLLGGWLPRADVALMTIAFVTLSLLWLAAAVLFLVQQAVWFGLSLGLGVSLSYVALQGLERLVIDTGTALFIAVAVGLVVVLLTTGLVSRRAFQHLAMESSAGQQIMRLPPRAHLIASLAPYFIYGVLYVTFILAGHVPGWVGHVPSGDRMAAITVVEIGLTLALGGYVLVGGIAENTLHRFWIHARHYQQCTSLADIHRFNRRLHRFFRQEQRRFLGALVLCSGVMLLGAVALSVLAQNASITVLPWTPATMIIFIQGLAGYGLLAWGIFNCMFMITLSQPRKALSALAVGIFVTLALGIIVSLNTSFIYGGVGLIAGSLVFALVSIKRVRNLWQRADYFTYASF